MADFKRSYFNELQDYIQGGSKDKISEDAEKYLDVLYILINLRRKYGKENAIAFIQRPPFSINYRRARLMFDEAVNLFYMDDGIDNQAMNNMIAEDIFKAAQVVLLTAKSAKDMEIYGKLMMQGREAKGLNKEEPPKLPEEFYKKPIKVYSLDPTAIKLEAADGRRTGWSVQLMSIGQANIGSNAEYNFMMELMSGKNPVLPKLLIDRSTCPNLKSQLEKTRTKTHNARSGAKLIVKEKKTDKLSINRLPKESTNFTDAFKYLLCRRNYLRSVNNKSNSIGTSINAG